MSMYYDINGSRHDAQVKAVYGDDLAISDAFFHIYASALLFCVVGVLCAFFDVVSKFAPAMLCLAPARARPAPSRGAGGAAGGGGPAAAAACGLRHLAVIMDGNRRYGESAHGDALRGHRAGAEALLSFVDHCLAEGVEMLTVYAFSTENWRRSRAEVDALMGALCDYSEDVGRAAEEKGIRVRVLASDEGRLPAEVRRKLRRLERRTALHSRFSLNVCVSYGARQEIANAARRAAEDAVAGRIRAEDIDEAAIAERLCGGRMREPDVLLRTSGEKRLSNFMLFQLAYAELVFVDKLWPEMGRDDLRDVIKEFRGRKRRFGR